MKLTIVTIRALATLMAVSVVLIVLLTIVARFFGPEPETILLHRAAVDWAFLLMIVGVLAIAVVFNRRSRESLVNILTDS